MQVDKAKCLQNTSPSDFVGANPTLPSEMILDGLAELEIGGGCEPLGIC